jgi:starvation-inducible DNA-binding protein
MKAGFTVPGMTDEQADKVIGLLDDRMVSLIDLSLTLKHVHWNVVGSSFIGVHEMLDPQTDAVRLMVDELAERIATFGGTPVGTPAALVNRRRWDDYDVGRADVATHLRALDSVFTGVIEDHRKAQDALGDLDPVSEDMIISQLTQLEQFQWFIRAHLENAAGEIG